LLLSLSRRQGVAPTDIPGIPNDGSNLDAFNPEQGESAAGPAPFSRPEATQARRAAESVVGYSLALCALVALRCDSFAHFAGRSTRGLRHTLAAAISGGALTGRHTVTGVRHGSEVTVLRHLETESSLVAIGLAVMAIGYGSLLLISWRQPATTVSTSPVATAHLAAVDTTIAESTPAIVAVTPPPPDRAVDAPPRVRVMSASTLNTIWRRNDTRSLQQAFAGLRRETLVFHRCSMKMTSADRAVARCDGVAGLVEDDSEGAAPRATWTFDFQRTGGRWAIRRVTNR
jgi:hypothetical protein